MEYEVSLTALTYGGDALGRLPDGKAVFVPFALPGEKVRLRIKEEKRGYARGELLEVIQPAVERIRPRCLHYTVCGGCHYQHLAYESQLVVKAAIVSDQLKRIAGVDAKIAAVAPSPSEWYYRNTVQFHLTPEGKLGFLAPDSHTVIPISECHLPEGALNELWPQLEFEAGTGLERVELRLGGAEETMLVLEGNEPDAPEFSTDLPVSAVYCGSDGEARVLAGDQDLVMQSGGRAFQVSAQSFFQVNTLQARAMADFLLARLPLHRTTTLLDVYCGVGFFSAFVAPHVGKVVGVELSPSACEDFAVNLDEFDNVDLFVGAAEDVLPDLELQPDIAIIDPPRAGMAPAALQALLALQPAVIAYVSCDLATLARDTRRLIQDGYHLEEVTPFDLFPQTYAIETVSLFKRGMD
jgi:23S rRNA (uracil1939-C5)-methyltransferase